MQIGCIKNDTFGSVVVYRQISKIQKLYKIIVQVSKRQMNANILF